ncbi:MAG: ribonuclease III [Polyangiaceae bacterium]|nr:ribonuclease III [Polyangiaceae bacterium]
MSEGEHLAAARSALVGYLAGVVGPGPIARLDEALSHASFANETGCPDNQRLEFLGDAVLGLCVSEMLVTTHGAADEGKLTRMRSALVNADSLAGWARRVNLGDCIAFGRGAKLGTEREQTNVLADAAEAVVAAVYEAHGMPGARALVHDMVKGRIASADALATPDPKSALQERVQAGGAAAPVYRVVGIHGAQHEQVFEVEVWVGERSVARGEGRSKRIAEREAAAAALAILESEVPASTDPRAPETSE